MPLPDDLTVHFLIDEESGDWNEGLIRTCFTEGDADKILQIPLSKTTCEDFPAWPHSKTEERIQIKRKLLKCGNVFGPLRRRPR